VITRTSI